MKKTIKTERGSYDITVERGALARAGELFDLNRRVLILSDDGVPDAYVQAIAAQCKAPTVVILPQGEASKSLSSFEAVLRRMLDAGFVRTDALVAVGGGVCGDLGGFVASAFMRGVDFYNIPTTLLSQVDSSIGGKTAVDLGGIKNCVGAFYPPRGVIIDPDVLATLSARQFACGMAEVIKMASTSDAALFLDLEQGLGETDIAETISRALDIKAAVVEADEREGGLRRVLNFGHTVGHGIESCTDLFHGECVALGMLPMCAPDVRARLVPLLARYALPTEMQGESARVAAAVLHDKKLAGDELVTVFVPAVGQYEFRRVAAKEFAAQVEKELSR